MGQSATKTVWVVLECRLLLELFLCYSVLCLLHSSGSPNTSTLRINLLKYHNHSDTTIRTLFGEPFRATFVLIGFDYGLHRRNRICAICNKHNITVRHNVLAKTHQRSVSNNQVPRYRTYRTVNCRLSRVTKFCRL